jgi:hypothetical protein
MFVEGIVLEAASELSSLVQVELLRSGHWMPAKVNISQACGYRSNSHVDQRARLFLIN